MIQTRSSLDLFGSGAVRLTGLALFGLLLLWAMRPELASAADETEHPLVKRSVELHGGSIYERSLITLTMASKSGAFRVEARNEEGLFDYRVIRLTDQGDGTVYRHSNMSPDYSDILELFEDGQKIELDDEGRQRVSNAVAARVWFAFQPMRLDDGNIYKLDQGLEEWGGRELRRVKVTFEPETSNRSQDAYVFWFDPDTARLEQYAYSFDGGLRFRPLENHRRVGGILFFDQPNYAIDAEGMSVDQIDPDFVSNEMTLLSTVELRDISVEPL